MVVDEYPGDSRILMIDQCSDKVATPLLQFMLGAVKAEMKETQALLMSMVGNACPSEFFGKSQNNTCILLVKLSHSRKVFPQGRIGKARYIFSVSLLSPEKGRE
jgi:hypothetical protein